VLLNEGASVRFVPDTNYNGSAGNISFVAWAQTRGRNGDTGADASINGGSTAFSTAFETATLNINQVNDSVTITGLAGDGLSYNEGDAPTLIERSGDALVIDIDSSDFDGGNLTVSIASGGDASEDLLSIRDQGIGAGQIGFSGGNVTYQGTLIGTASGGSAGADLVISFNANATPEAATALVKNITYENTDAVTPTTGARTVNFSIDDGDSGISVNHAATVTVYSVNDAPTITNIAGDTLSYNEGDGVVIIGQGNDEIVADVDSADFDGGDLTVSIASGVDAAEDIISVRDQGMGAGQIGFSGGNVFYGGVQIGSATGGSGGTDLVVSLNASATPTAVTALVKNITYENTDTSEPTSGSRVIRFTVSDGDGASSSTSDVTVSVATVNDAPVLDNTGTMTMTNIYEDDMISTGNTVSSIISSAGGDRITDVDSVPVEGFAVTGVDNSNGQWQFNAGGGWTNFGTVTDASAVLLDGSASIRFVPNADYFGSAGDVTFRAWDQSSGTSGQTAVDTSTNGGISAFSSATETTTLTVTAVSDAPVLDNTGTMTLTSILEDTTDPAGDTVGAIIASAGGDRITDIDASPDEGIAVVGVDDTNGTWEYSTDFGAGWAAFGTVSDTEAVLLATTDMIRFVPDADYNGSAGDITFRAWDQTSGDNGDIEVDVSINGNSTAFSSATETASLTVNSVNDLPVAVADTAGILEDATDVTGNVITNDTLGDGTAPTTPWATAPQPRMSVPSVPASMR
jgi:hypothetical protein